ncbi:MAG: PIG-L deacetylase family protein [Crocinitomicaceae bacterium]
MIFTKKKILILAPHTDDGEFGCGATINKFITEGHEVYYVAFSACEQSVLAKFPGDILRTEVKKATQRLGIPKENLILCDYKVRTMNYHRQEILDDMIKLRTEINPDMIFLPCLDDIHQDHKTIAEEGLRAFKFSTILQYEMPWNNISFTTSNFVKLSEEHVQAKVEALAEYKSQAHRLYANENFIRSLATTRGVQINTQYAEAFSILRWIID